jgi:chorismate-pyruvate lyase
LGWYLYYHQEQHEQAQVLGGVLVTAFLGWALNSGAHALKGRLIRWDLRSGDRKLTEPPGATRPVSRTALMALPQPLKDLLTTSRVSETLQQQMGVPIRPTILHQGRPYMVPRDAIQFFGPNLKSGQVIQRDVLVQDPAGDPVLLARSWAHLGAFSERSRNDLQSQQQTLGQILRGNHEPCSYRDLRLREVTSQRLWLLFRKQGSPRLLQRERLISVAGRPAALIHEFVPLP